MRESFDGVKCVDSLTDEIGHTLSLDISAYYAQINKFGRRFEFSIFEHFDGRLVITSDPIFKSESEARAYLDQEFERKLSITFKGEEW